MKIFFQGKYLLILLALVIVVSVLFFSFKSKVPNFSDYQAGHERKAAFFSYFYSLINENNKLLATTRKQLEQWHQNKKDLSWWDERKLIDLTVQYRVKNFTIEDDDAWERLLKKVDVLPPSLVLAQAANESAWGTSRFAKLANNYFGQWCFEKGCGLVPKQRSAGKAHEVADFDTPNASVESYMQNLNSHPAYQLLRDIRAQHRKNNLPVTGHALAAGLIKYSERGEEYIEELRAMIKFNQLDKYDQKTQVQ